MTYNEANNLAERFLVTLDEFGITSGDVGDKNWLCETLLAAYWDDQGVIEDEIW